MTGLHLAGFHQPHQTKVHRPQRAGMRRRITQLAEHRGRHPFDGHGRRRLNIENRYVGATHFFEARKHRGVIADQRRFACAGHTFQR